jgi:hypothetical protein
VVVVVAAFAVVMMTHDGEFRQQRLADLHEENR